MGASINKENIHFFSVEQISQFIEDRAFCLRDVAGQVRGTESHDFTSRLAVALRATDDGASNVEQNSEKNMENLLSELSLFPSNEARQFLFKIASDLLCNRCLHPYLERLDYLGRSEYRCVNCKEHIMDQHRLEVEELKRNQIPHDDAKADSGLLSARRGVSIG